MRDRCGRDFWLVGLFNQILVESLKNCSDRIQNKVEQIFCLDRKENLSKKKNNFRKKTKPKTINNDDDLAE